MELPQFEGLTSVISAGVALGLYWLVNSAYQKLKETKFDRQVNNWSKKFDETTQAANMELRQIIEDLDAESMKNKMFISTLEKQVHDCKLQSVNERERLERKIESLQNIITEYEAENYIERRKKEKD